MAIYKYNDDIQLTPHLNCREFKCKCNGKHDYTVNDRLPQMLEKVVELLGADHIYISSGYRCRSHDLAIGGFGGGQHTCGNAADFAIEKDGKFIDPRVIAAVAEEVGFGGIGRIDLQYIHCDVRTSNIWRGDEYAGATNYSLFDANKNNYWSYYGLNRADYIKGEPVPEPAEELSLEKQLQTVLNKMGESLVVDGIIGEKTLAALKRCNIQKGEKGEFIRIMQEYLNKKGYNCGEADSIAGDMTMQALCNAAWDKLFTE